MSVLRIELYYDDEATNWHFRVPALRIIGGGVATREQAERACLEAIQFALEGDPRDFDGSSDAVTFEVTIKPAA